MFIYSKVGTDMMTEGKIDIHHYQRQLEAGLSGLENNRVNLSERNIALIRRFCNDCSLGKTVLKRAKKRISAGRVVKYLYTLKQVAFWLQTDFDQVTQEQMEDLVRKIDSNQLHYLNSAGELVPRTYTEWTRHDIKVTLKKFYKWLHGNNEEYPPLVRWIDTYVEEKEVPSLSLEEVERMTAYARTARDKAVVITLFETGARAEEFLNIRLKHCQDKEDHFSIRIVISKTYARTLAVSRSARFLRDWLLHHPAADDPEAQLFPIKYTTLCKMLARLSGRTLGRHVTPHVLRHSCATWLAGKRIGRYQLCKWMGWAMSSDMPDRYIDRAGVLTQETMNLVREDEVSKMKKENEAMRDELTLLKNEQNQFIDTVKERKPYDDTLSKVLRDKRLLSALTKEILRQGLAEGLLRK